MTPRLDSVRFLQYAVAFVGLMVFLFAVSGLSALLLSQLLPATRSLVSGSSFRQEVSYFLAALIVATPLWLFFWRAVQRRIQSDQAEIGARERHLFLALVSAIGLITALFAFHTVLRVVFSLPAEHGAARVLQDLAPAFIRLIVYGGAGALSLRTAWQENRLHNPAQDLAMFVASAFALVFLAIGALDAVRAIIGEVSGSGGDLILGSSQRSLTLIWAQTAAWIVSGGAFWAAISSFDRSHSVRRDFRLLYLYVVLAVAVAMTIIAGTDLLYELLRRAFGYSTGATWHFLQDTAPWVVVGAVLWVYHWMALRSLSGEEDAARPVPPERRLAVAGYTFIGTAMAASGAAVLLWLVLDGLFGTHSTSLLGERWWIDRLSTGIALLAVGITSWAPSWRLMQRAATDPDERGSTERRWLVGGATLIATLVAIGYTIAFLWTVLQALLGAGLDTETASNLFKYLGTALIALGVAAYYGTTLRNDIRLSPSRRRARILALVEPGGEALLQALRESEGRRLRVAGYLTGPVAGAHLGSEALRARLAAPDTDRVLLILGPEGAVMYPYTENPEAARLTENSPSAPLPAPGS